MKRPTIYITLLTLLLLLLIAIDLYAGGIKLSFVNMSDVERQIFYDLRMPRVITAVLAGISLSVSGLMMQTLFRNPLAGPYILGVSSGAMLGVGLLLMVGTLVGFRVSGGTLVSVAILGAYILLFIVLLISKKLRNNVSVLIIGMMFGSIAGALVNIMQSFANPDSLKLFIVWSMGSLTSVSWSDIPMFGIIIVVGLILSFCLIKPLNGLQLGEENGKALGINIELTRFLIIIATGLMAGCVTAYCGPIAFIGVATPHLARGILRNSNHRQTMPLTAILGANILVICDFLTNQFTYPLPISTMSALFAAPIIIAVICKGNRLLH